MKIFVYDDIMQDRIINTLKLPIQREQVAEAEGKLYNIQRHIYMLKPNDVTFNRGNKRVLGALYTIPDEEANRVLYHLDNYKGCSLSRLGRRHPHDLTYRATITVYPLSFKDIHEFQNYDYKYLKPVKCLVYLGNPKHEKIIRAIRVTRHQKLSDGYHKKSLENLLKRMGYISEKQN